MSDATAVDVTDELLIDTVGRVRLLTMNRPESLNAFSWSLHDKLVQAFLDAAVDPEVWVIVVTGTGDRAFSAGTDLKEMRSKMGDSQPLAGPMKQARRTLWEVVSETYKPTIAALNGATIGGGFELALACDIRIAVPGCKLALPEAKIGMGGLFGTVMLPRRIPLGMALEYLFTGDYMSAEEAYRLGLVNRVVPADQLQKVTMELAQKIAANAPLSVRRMKEMALKGLTLPLSAAFALDVGPNPYTAEDREEGIRAFLEKRPPRWSGR